MNKCPRKPCFNDCQCLSGKDSAVTIWNGKHTQTHDRPGHVRPAQYPHRIAKPILAKCPLNNGCTPISECTSLITEQTFSKLTRSSWILERDTQSFWCSSRQDDASEPEASSCLASMHDGRPIGCPVGHDWRDHGPRGEQEAHFGEQRGNGPILHQKLGRVQVQQVQRTDARQGIGDRLYRAVFVVHSMPLHQVGACGTRGSKFVFNIPTVCLLACRVDVLTNECNLYGALDNLANSTENVESISSSLFYTRDIIEDNGKGLNPPPLFPPLPQQ